MRKSLFLATLCISVWGVAVWAQGQPNCTGVSLNIDARCGCVKDPSSELCKMVKAGFYDPNRSTKPITLDWGFTGVNPKGGNAKSGGRAASSPRQAQPAAARQARVEPLAHRDYLRFLHPNAQLIAGGDIGALFGAADMAGILLGSGEGPDARNKVITALREMDHLWISVAPGNDIVMLMTGKFEQGQAAGLFYSRGIQPVFLGGAGAMMIGAEPSIQAALVRLTTPAGAGNWVAGKAREIAKDHETLIVSEKIVSESDGTAMGPSTLPPIRRFALGFRLTGEAGVDAEVETDSEAAAAAVSSWVERMKDQVRQRTGVGALDAIEVAPAGTAVRFRAADNELLTGEAGKAALNSEFGVELYALLLAGFPGAPARTVADDKVRAVKAGMQREDLLALLGQPAAVSSIQGLAVPRETWTYQIPFGGQFAVKLENGVVTGTLIVAR